MLTSLSSNGVATWMAHEAFGWRCVCQVSTPQFSSFALAASAISSTAFSTFSTAFSTRCGLKHRQLGHPRGRALSFASSLLLKLLLSVFSMLSSGVHPISLRLILTPSQRLDTNKSGEQGQLQERRQDKVSVTRMISPSLCKKHFHRQKQRDMTNRAATVVTEIRMKSFSETNSLLVFMDTAIGDSSPLWCTKHLMDTSFSSPDWTVSVLMTRVVPSACGSSVVTGGPLVRLSLSTFHTISAGGRDTEVQLASITPGEVVL
ncbi:hypothetical protein EYF80_030474 [Liparis tanakae]|uniref:Uncharacterized protein n=1 Tax=Liparis tanakae TaxID=230148 RepID=A0A4Z2H094_9TELE|nr:hypothetical protein EYF80_030474 [Liparis tanakae]